MLSRIESAMRRARRSVSRSEWLARLLKLSISEGTEAQPGLVLIQIDGLAKVELEKALASGEMPFLARLIDRENYKLRSLYSGIPSTTPAAQGELFYGVKAVVPGFNFMRRSTSQLVRMYEPQAAAETEQQLMAEGGPALLREGSGYVGNFTAGAQESHFCPTSQGWGSSLRDSHPLVVTLLVLANLYSFARALILVVVEVFIAVYDFFRGLTRGKDLIAELLFVPSRVLIVILLRELTTIGVKIDIARGLPIIHLNFLGYDEQAHRRGPSSLFAHWTLKGIDDAIARIWRAALQSSRRDYDVWIYSDHGQEEVEPYEKRHGRSVAEAVARVVAEHESRSVSYRCCGHMGMQLQRVEMFGGRRTQRLFGVGDTNTLGIRSHTGSETSLNVTIASLGPLAQVYFDAAATPEKLASLAMALVQKANIPLVLHRNESGLVVACTMDGTQPWSEYAAMQLGDEHRFMQPVTEDLARLCDHADSGDLILCGSCPGLKALSFAMENGAHGGMGLTQTEAFTLLPADIRLPKRRSGDARAYSRMLDLRSAVLTFLGRADTANLTKTPSAARAASTARVSVGGTADSAVRIMTYNVHSCIGMDGKLSPQRIARIIARYKPDIVALQELESGRSKTGFVDQAMIIARYTSMDYCFHPALHVRDEGYGNAVLSRFPMRLVKADALPRPLKQPKLEPRGALWVAIDVYGRELNFLTTHLGLQAGERLLQVQALLGDDWLSHPHAGHHTILCGDFNFGPGSRECRLLSSLLVDAQQQAPNHRPASTFFGRMPAFRIDHVFLNAHFDVRAVNVPSNALLRLASDHLPLIVDLQIN